MKVFVIVVALIGIHKLYVSSVSLQIQVNGENTSDTQFCINQTLTFVCTVQVNGIEWTVGSLLTDGDGIISVGSGGALRTITVGPSRMFTLTAQGAGAPNFRSSLTVTSTPELNNAEIMCADSITSSNNQTAMVTVYDLDMGYFSVNDNLVGSHENSALYLNIPFSLALDICLDTITAILSINNGSATSTIRHVGCLTTFIGSTFTLTFEGLNLCNHNYNYSVMGFGVINNEPVTGEIEVSISGRIENVQHFSGINKVTITMDVIFDECPNSAVQIVRSDGKSKEIYVGRNQTLEFTDSEGTIAICTAYVMFNFRPRIIGSFDCSTENFVLPSASLTTILQSGTRPDPTGTHSVPAGTQSFPISRVNLGVFIGIGIITATIITVLVFIIIVVGYKVRLNKKKKNKKRNEVEYEDVNLEDVKNNNMTDPSIDISEVNMVECPAYESALQLTARLDRSGTEQETTV